MASLLRQLVAGPRTRHPEAGLDLCYVTDNIIATSGPSQTYPQLAYRNPLDQLVKFLDTKHGEDWAIWEFRAEGTGYPDEAVYNRIRHYPWPDHHPPPFRLIPLIMANMRNWLHGGDLNGAYTQSSPIAASDEQKKGDLEEKRKKRVAVVHCKAGKGRSGTATCSYLISEEGWTPEDALGRFTERRMRPQFGAGVSIPSQLRWISYVDRWTRGGKKYVDRPVEVVEIHVWGLRSGVKVDVEGFADEGKQIELLHTFKKSERILVDGTEPEEANISDVIWEMAGYPASRVAPKVPEGAAFADATNAKSKSSESHSSEDDKGQDRSKAKAPSRAKTIKRRGTELLHKVTPSDKSKSKTGASAGTTDNGDSSETEPGGMAVILKPVKPIGLAHSDINISVERRNKTPKSMGLTMVTAVAHVWFNTFFEGQGPENDGKPANSGVFGIEWDAMDGIKGSSRKGTRGFDRIAVVWRTPGTSSEEKQGQEEQGEVIVEPGEDEPVPQTTAANWKGASSGEAEKDLGLRVQSPDSADVSKASSIKSLAENKTDKGKEPEDSESLEGVKTSGPAGEDLKPDEETNKKPAETEKRNEKETKPETSETKVETKDTEEQAQKQ